MKTGHGLKPGLKPYVKLECARAFTSKRSTGNGERARLAGRAVYLGGAVDDQPLWSGDLAVRYELACL